MRDRWFVAIGTSIALCAVICTVCSCKKKQPVSSRQTEETSGYATSPSEEDLTMLATEASRLTAQECEKLEEEFEKDQQNLSLRIKLLGYYSSKRFTSDPARKAYQQHVLWIIENKPEIHIAGTPYAELHPVLDKEVYLDAKTLWLEQIEKHADDTRVIGNAANFFFIHERSLAEELLKKAQTLDPQNPKWPQKLAHLYNLSSILQMPDSKSTTAAEALKQMETSLTLTSSDLEKYYMLPDLAKMAFKAGDMNKAENYAKNMLTQAPKYKGDWNYGNAIHYGNLILGRLALKAGDTDGAKQYLLEAGKTPGSPQLNSFGPNMALAKELLEKGEADTVLEYFQLCAKFWKMGQDKLNDWTALLKGAKPPIFE